MFLVHASWPLDEFKQDVSTKTFSRGFELGPERVVEGNEEKDRENKSLNLFSFYKLKYNPFFR